MSVQLLDKTRKINKLLHNNNSSKVVFNDICDVLTETMESNVLVVSKKGKILGIGRCAGVELIQELIENKVGTLVDKMLNERMLNVLSTKENVNLRLASLFQNLSYILTNHICHTDITHEFLLTKLIHVPAAAFSH